MHLYNRPRLYNILHALHIVNPYSQTRSAELDCLARFAQNRRAAIEIGTFMGISAGRIAASLLEDGRIYCVDPYEGGEALKAISLRHLRRCGVLNKIVWVRKHSHDAARELPQEADFIFVDGDHSWTGIETDWLIVKESLCIDGIVCFHDTSPLPEEGELSCESVRFFNEVIRKDEEFEHIETCCTLNVLRRRRN